MKLNRKVRKKLKTAAIIFLLFVMGFSVYKIWTIESQYQQSSKAYAEITELVVIPKTKNEVVDDSEAAPDPANDPGSRKDGCPYVDFAALTEINKDIAGWLFIADTNISYPVARGKDNSYYLNHMYNKEWNSAGCLFLDCGNSRDFSDPNSVIYGHHMKNGTMFYQLDGYKNQDFYDGHKTAYLLTPEKDYLIEFFAGYVASVWDEAWRVKFQEGKFEPWYTAILEKSCFESDVAPTPEDRIVTLSTCSYEFDNARFVLFGVLREKNE